VGTSCLLTSFQFFFGEQVRNFWRRLRNSSQQKLKEFNEMFILVFSNNARVFVLASVENHHLRRLYIDILEQLKLTAFNCDLVHSLFGKVDQFNFLQAHWTLHRRSPPSQKFNSRAPARFGTGARLLLASAMTSLLLRQLRLQTPDCCPQVRGASLHYALRYPLKIQLKEQCNGHSHL
jgi:hypothetical protein